MNNSSSHHHSSMNRIQVHQIARFMTCMMMSLWKKEISLSGLSIDGQNESVSISSKWFTVPTSALPLEWQRFEKFCHQLLWSTKIHLSGALYALNAIYRFHRRFPEISKTRDGHFRLIVVCMMAANKILDDCTYTNRAWAKLTGRHVQEINKWELEYLQCMGYSLRFYEREYNRWTTILREFLVLCNTSQSFHPFQTAHSSPTIAMQQQQQQQQQQNNVIYIRGKEYRVISPGHADHPSSRHRHYPHHTAAGVSVPI